MSLLSNSTSFGGYENSTPLTEVAKNTRKSLEYLEKISCASSSTSVASSNYYTTQVCMVDDVNNNLSLLVPYIKIISVNPTTGAITTIGNYDYNYAPYSPTNPLLASSIGTTPILKQGRTRLVGGTWSPTSLIKSYTIRVKTGTPTFTDSFGETTSLETGEVITFGEAVDLMDTVPILTVTAGSEVFVNYVTF